jgi:aromatic-amino-acid transaminase
VANYPYYHAATHGLDFAGMLSALRSAAPRTIIVLHACCHNPTGVDPTAAQWAQIVSALRDRDLVPFLDLAYQGFGAGLEADRAAIDLLAGSGLPFVVSSSFSKSFSLYGERVGALTLVARDADEARRVRSQLKRVIRTNYSNPPTHGGALVAAVLGDPGLRAQWEAELGVMRDRIRAMRESLVRHLAALLPGRDFSFVSAQRGMFSYSGLTAAQVERLRTEFGIYAVSTGRICVAALNSRNVEIVAKAIAEVSKA